MPATMFTGTAIGYDNFLAKFKGHLTDASLGEQKWTILKDTGTEIYLKGPGSSPENSDDLYVIMQTDSNAASQEYGLWLRGAFGFDANANWGNQPGATPASCYFQLAESTTIQYWLWVNGTHFKTIVKIGQFYLSMYCGFLIRYGTPAEIPYPLVIAGSSSRRFNYAAISSHQTSNFWHPASYDGEDNFATDSNYSASMYYHDTVRWIKCANTVYTDGAPTAVLGKVWPNDTFRDLGRSPSRKYTLLPLILNNITPNSSPSTGNLFGEFDEVYWVSGFGVTPESTITIGGKTYICFPNHTYAGVGDFVAIPLG